MSVYNSGVKTRKVYTILSYTTYCHFAIKSFDIEGWAKMFCLSRRAGDELLPHGDI